MSRITSKIKNMSPGKKNQLVAAVALTLALAIVLPVFAWFTNQKKAAEMYKIEYPNTLFLNAAHREDCTNFEINGINADEVLTDYWKHPILYNGSEQKITSKYYVFNVTGDSIDKFTIQLAYTTNNPFTYELYAAKELSEEPSQTSGTEVNFVEYSLTGETVDGMPSLSGESYHINARPPDIMYYQIDTSVTEGYPEGEGPYTPGRYYGRYLNSTDGTDADRDPQNSYYEMAYSDYSNTHQDAKPVYWQATNVSAFPGSGNPNKLAFSRHFILKVKWNAGELKNTQKETDIIYISVKATA